MIDSERRHLVLGTAALALFHVLFGFSTANVVAGEQPSSKPYAPLAGPRSRTIFLNDLSGDVDGLFAAAHQALSTSTELRAIVGTGTGRPSETAELSAARASEMLELMGMTARVKVYSGATGKITAPGVPMRSPGTQAIIDEAMRTDTKLPLYVAVGGGLTEVASALMLEPRIADRLTLVWIGGEPYPAGGTGETNFGIDPIAAQYVFNETSVPIWQVPRNVYATCLVSDTELQAFVAPNGKIGAWLYGKVFEAARRWGGAINTGETYTLGDSPLVVLTSSEDWVPSTYQPSFRYQRTGSSFFDEVIAPHLNGDGSYGPSNQGRQIRVYKSIDTRMMLNDFFAKLRINYGS